VLAQQEPTFRVDVQLVRMLATVKDNYGKPVGGLAKEDFTVFDNGVRQQISLFERHTAQPLSVAVLLDVSGSTAREMKYQTDAVHRFLTALFSEGNPEDQAALYTFNWQVVQNVDFTRNPERFRLALRNLKAEAGTSMYDAILLTARDVEERDGRHVVILVTDGGDTVSRTNFQQALEAVHRADAVVYPILTVPISNDAGRNVGGENALTHIAQTTGGRLFAPGINGLDQAFEEILRDLRTQYLIGYYPKSVPPTRERFHRIEIKISRPGLRVVTRTGYYGEFEPSGGGSGSDASRNRAGSSTPEISRNPVSSRK
jgi:Ca-activated chloride channel family protein